MIVKYTSYENLITPSLSSILYFAFTTENIQQTLTAVF